MNSSANKSALSYYYIALIVFGIIAGISIASGKLQYLLLFLSIPLIILCIKKPFIFPFGLYVALLPLEPLLVLTGERGGATLTKFIGILTALVLLFKGVFEKNLKYPDNAALWWI